MVIKTRRFTAHIELTWFRDVFSGAPFYYHDTYVPEVFWFGPFGFSR